MSRYKENFARRAFNVNLRKNPLEKSRMSKLFTFSGPQISIYDVPFDSNFGISIFGKELPEFTTERSKFEYLQSLKPLPELKTKYAIVYDYTTSIEPVPQCAQGILDFAASLGIDFDRWARVYIEQSNKVAHQKSSQYAIPLAYSWYCLMNLLKYFLVTVHPVKTDSTNIIVSENFSDSINLNTRVAVTCDDSYFPRSPGFGAILVPTPYGGEKYVDLGLNANSIMESVYGVGNPWSIELVNGTSTLKLKEGIHLDFWLMSVTLPIMDYYQLMSSYKVTEVYPGGPQSTTYGYTIIAKDNPAVKTVQVAYAKLTQAGKDAILNFISGDFSPEYSYNRIDDNQASVNLGNTMIMTQDDIIVLSDAWKGSCVDGIRVSEIAHTYNARLGDSITVNVGVATKAGYKDDDPQSPIYGYEVYYFKQTATITEPTVFQTSMVIVDEGQTAPDVIDQKFIAQATDAVNTAFQACLPTFGFVPPSYSEANTDQINYLNSITKHWDKNYDLIELSTSLLAASSLEVNNQLTLDAYVKTFGEYDGLMSNGKRASEIAGNISLAELYSARNKEADFVLRQAQWSASSDDYFPQNLQQLVTSLVRYDTQINSDEDAGNKVKLLSNILNESYESPIVRTLQDSLKIYSSTLLTSGEYNGMSSTDAASDYTQSMNQVIDEILSTTGLQTTLSGSAISESLKLKLQSQSRSIASVIKSGIYNSQDSLFSASKAAYNMIITDGTLIGNELLKIKGATSFNDEVLETVTQDDINIAYERVGDGTQLYTGSTYIKDVLLKNILGFTSKIGSYLVTGVVTASMLLVKAVNIVFNTATSLVGSYFNLLQDGVSFKFNKNYSMPVFDIPILTGSFVNGSTEASTLAWKYATSRDLGNFFNIPISKNLRILMCPNPENRSNVDWILYLTMSNKVDESGKFIPISNDAEFLERLASSVPLIEADLNSYLSNLFPTSSLIQLNASALADIGNTTSFLDDLKSKYEPDQLASSASTGAIVGLALGAALSFLLPGVGIVAGIALAGAAAAVGAAASAHNEANDPFDQDEFDKYCNARIGNAELYSTSLMIQSIFGDGDIGINNKEAISTLINSFINWSLFGQFDLATINPELVRYTPASYSIMPQTAVMVKTDEEVLLEQKDNFTKFVAITIAVAAVPIAIKCGKKLANFSKNMIKNKMARSRTRKMFQSELSEFGESGIISEDMRLALESELNESSDIVKNIGAQLETTSDATHSLISSSMGQLATLTHSLLYSSNKLPPI